MDYLLTRSARRAEQITEQLKALFERNGCLVGKYANAVNPIEKIAQEIPDFPEVTLDSLRELLGEKSTDDHPDLERILELAESAVKQTIPNNPADLISNRPDRTTYHASYYDEEQISTYLHIVKGTKMEPPVLFASFYGFRRSEVLGVKDTVANLRRHQLLVQHTVTIANIDHHTEVIKKDRTKSQHSLRSMPLVDTVETAILEASERQEHYRKKFGSFYCREDQHYLCRDECGQLLKPDYVTAKHKALLEAHRLPHIRFHDLRHPYVKLTTKKFATFFENFRATA